MLYRTVPVYRSDNLKQSATLDAMLRANMFMVSPVVLTIDTPVAFFELEAQRRATIPGALREIDLLPSALFCEACRARDGHVFG